MTKGEAWVERLEEEQGGGEVCDAVGTTANEKEYPRCGTGGPGVWEAVVAPAMMTYC